MPSVMQLVRSLGNAGAVANAEAPIAARRHEEAVVRALAARVVAPSPPRPAVAPGDGRAA